MIYGGMKSSLHLLPKFHAIFFPVAPFYLLLHRTGLSETRTVHFTEAVSLTLDLSLIFFDNE